MRISVFAKSSRVFQILVGRRDLTSKVSMDIQTFAFLDTETTGLPYQEYNKTKLTELCLTVVQTDHIRLGVYPRVQNKLTFCLNPCKMVNPIAEEVTGLSNILLEYQPSFTKETVEIIQKFLQLQRKPVCLVAHNGNNFDYPILRAEIHRTGAALPDDILCIDSLSMFRELHKKKQEPNAETAPSSTACSSSDSSIPAELCDGFDELICQCVDEFERTAQKLNETTPTKGAAPQSVAQKGDDPVNVDDLYFSPNRSFSTTVKTLTVVPAPTAKKRLTFEKPSFKLTDIYERLTKKTSENAHRAEDDCHMLLECAATLGEEFVDWANENAVKLCDIAMMRPGRKIGS